MKFITFTIIGIQGAWNMSENFRTESRLLPQTILTNSEDKDVPFNFYFIITSGALHPSEGFFTYIQKISLEMVKETRKDCQEKTTNFCITESKRLFLSKIARG